MVRGVLGCIIENGIEQDTEELLALQKTNAKICSNATALVDESEEELGKIDTWLVSYSGIVFASRNLVAKEYRCAKLLTSQRDAVMQEIALNITCPK